jgi:hypothetical protein
MQKRPQGFVLQPSSTQFTQPKGRGNPYRQQHSQQLQQLKLLQQQQLL